eukprot:c3594_g1_i1.p1 GENE.c3594_g1_i1~~c3594_g1_i1.p1  ORF type:complete len:115 (-),score=2.41 c3594_g1_i1:55-399(-)
MNIENGTSDGIQAQFRLPRVHQIYGTTQRIRLIERDGVASKCATHPTHASAHFSLKSVLIDWNCFTKFFLFRFQPQLVYLGRERYRESRLSHQAINLWYKFVENVLGMFVSGSG